MSKYGCGIKVPSGKISYEILCSKHTLAKNKVSQNSPKSALKGSVVLYVCVPSRKTRFPLSQISFNRTENVTLLNVILVLRLCNLLGFCFPHEKKSKNAISFCETPDTK